MCKQYLRQAWQLMKQNCFFSTIYIIGTGLAISMVMVLAVVYHIRTANIVPEVNRGRTLYLSNASYKFKDGGSMSSSLGVGMVKECLLTLRKPEAVAIVSSSYLGLSMGNVFAQIPGGNEPYKVELKGTNDAFWQVFRFHFIEGMPYGSEDFQSGIPRVVLSRSMSHKLFGRTDVVGQALLLNEMEYTVTGVVNDVSGITPSVNADLWVPYTSLSEVQDAADEAEQTVGFLEACILARTTDDFDVIRSELSRQVGRYNTMLTEGKLELGVELLDHARNVVYLMTKDTDLTKVCLILGLLVFLFLLIPALNLSGLNDSRMQDRISELGLRKAFGARRSLLFTQIFFENMVLLLPGGAVGLLFSYLLVMGMRGLLLSPGIYAMVMGGTDLTLSVGLLLNFEVFAYAFLACLVLNVLSSMIPTWRAVRIPITDAINYK